MTKSACALILAGALASPALAGQGDPGSATGATPAPAPGRTTKGVVVNSESPRQHGQSEANANPAAVNPGSPILKGNTETAPKSR
jgi:hypothetical protein